MTEPRRLWIVGPRSQREPLERAAEHAGFFVTARERVSSDGLVGRVDAAIVSARTVEVASRVARAVRARGASRAMIVIAVGVESARHAHDLDAVLEGAVDPERVLAEVDRLLTMGVRGRGSIPPHPISDAPTTIDSAIDEELETLLATLVPPGWLGSVDHALDLLTQELPIWRGPTELLPRSQAAAALAPTRPSTMVGAGESFSTRVSSLVHEAERRLFPDSAPQGFTPAIASSVDEQLDELAAELEAFLSTEAPRDLPPTFDEDEGPHAPLRSLAADALSPVATPPPGEDTVVGHRRPAREPTAVTGAHVELGGDRGAADVLARLWREQFTGACRFRNDGDEYTIFCTTGRPTATLAREPWRRFGEVFAWSRGTCELQSGVEPPSEALPCTVDVVELILEGARRDVPSQFLEVRVGGEEVTVRRITADPPELAERLDPLERRALELWEGTRTLDDVARASGLGPERARRLAYALVTLGLFVVVSPPGRVSTALELGSDAVRALHALCEEGDYLSILGVDENANDDTILEAYEARRAQLVATSHGEPLTRELTLIREVLDEAYAVLRDPAARAAYASHLVRERT